MCVSVIRRYCVKTAKATTMQTTPHDSPWTVVFDAKDLGEIRMGSPQTGMPNTCRVG